LIPGVFRNGTNQFLAVEALGNFRNPALAEKHERILSRADSVFLFIFIFVFFAIFSTGDSRPADQYYFFLSLFLPLFLSLDQIHAIALLESTLIGCELGRNNDFGVLEGDVDQVAQCPLSYRKA